MVIDDALGVARGARGIVEGDGVPFVAGHDPGEVRVSPSHQLLIFDGAQTLAGAFVFGVVVVDDEGLRFGQRQSLFHHAGKFPVGDQHLGLRMVEGEGDDRRVEARVQRVQHRPRHGHAKVAFQHGRGIGEHDRHRVVLADPMGGKGAGEATRPGVEIAIIAPHRAMDHGQPVGEDRSGALEKPQRRQRLEIGGVAVKVCIVGDGHGRAPGIFAHDSARSGGVQFTL